MVQNYYFLTPLILINRFDAGRLNLGAMARQAVRHVVLWIASAFSGVLLALAMVYLLTGQVGLAPADWRHATPIESIPDLVRNLFSVSRYLDARVAAILQNGTGGNVYFFLLFIALLVLRFQAWRPELVRAAIVMIVGLSFFAFSVPMAPVIAMRSLVALLSAIVILLLVSHKQAGAVYWLSVFLLLWMGLNFSKESKSYFQKHKTETEYALRSIVTELPKLPSN